MQLKLFSFYSFYSISIGTVVICNLAISCIEVNVPRGRECITDNTVTVDSSSGYLSSYNTDHVSIGSQRCPWRLQVKPGMLVY